MGSPSQTMDKIYSVIAPGGTNEDCLHEKIIGNNSNKMQLRGSIPGI